jgi:predicted membrane channel-forming protein YqfA (hemolysin III family)
MTVYIMCLPVVVVLSSTSSMEQQPQVNTLYRLSLLLFLDAEMLSSTSSMEQQPQVNTLYRLSHCSCYLMLKCLAPLN